MDLLQMLCGCSSGGPLLSLLKLGVPPLFFMELWVILCNFWPILKKSIKPLTRNHSNYTNELLGSYVTWIFTIYYYMSLCNILFLTSLEPLHRFASNFVWMFLWWIPTKFVKIGVLPLFFMELWVILCNFLADS